MCINIDQINSKNRRQCENMNKSIQEELKKIEEQKIHLEQQNIDLKQTNIDDKQKVKRYTTFTYIIFFFICVICTFVFFYITYSRRK